MKLAIIILTILFLFYVGVVIRVNERYGFWRAKLYDKTVLVGEMSVSEGFKLSPDGVNWENGWPTTWWFKDGLVDIKLRDKTFTDYIGVKKASINRAGIFSNETDMDIYNDGFVKFNGGMPIGLIVGDGVTKQYEIQLVE